MQAANNRAAVKSVVDSLLVSRTEGQSLIMALPPSERTDFATLLINTSPENRAALAAATLFSSVEANRDRVHTTMYNHQVNLDSYFQQVDKDAQRLDSISSYIAALQNNNINYGKPSSSGGMLIERITTPSTGTGAALRSRGTPLSAFAVKQSAVLAPLENMTADQVATTLRENGGDDVLVDIFERNNITGADTADFFRDSVGLDALMRMCDENKKWFVFVFRVFRPMCRSTITGKLRLAIDYLSKPTNMTHSRSHTDNVFLDENNEDGPFPVPLNDLFGTTLTHPEMSPLQGGSPNGEPLRYSAVGGTWSFFGSQRKALTTLQDLKALLSAFGELFGYAAATSPASYSTKTLAFKLSMEVPAFDPSALLTSGFDGRSLVSGWLNSEPLDLWLGDDNRLKKNVSNALCKLLLLEVVQGDPRSLTESTLNVAMETAAIMTNVELGQIMNPVEHGFTELGEPFFCISHWSNQMLLSILVHGVGGLSHPCVPDSCLQGCGDSLHLEARDCLMKRNPPIDGTFLLSNGMHQTLLANLDCNMTKEVIDRVVDICMDLILTHAMHEKFHGKLISNQVRQMLGGMFCGCHMDPRVCLDDSDCAFNSYPVREQEKATKMLLASPTAFQLNSPPCDRDDASLGSVEQGTNESIISSPDRNLTSTTFSPSPSPGGENPSPLAKAKGYLKKLVKGKHSEPDTTSPRVSVAELSSRGGKKAAQAKSVPRKRNTVRQYSVGTRVRILRGEHKTKEGVILERKDDGYYGVQLGSGGVVLLKCGSLKEMMSKETP